VRLYPNPNNGRFTIDLEWANANSADRATIEVLNVMGQTVYQAELPITGNSTSMNISLTENIAKGMYHVRVRTNGMQTTRPLVIQ
jgi:methionine-rich copper-binding protein CopC